MTAVSTDSSKRFRSDQTSSIIPERQIRRSPRGIQYFPKLPHDIIAALMQFLPLQDVLNCQRLSSEWRDLFNNHPRIWRVIFKTQKLYYTNVLLPQRLCNSPINKNVVVELYRQKFVLYAIAETFSSHPYLCSFELKNIMRAIFMAKQGLISTKGIASYAPLPDLQIDKEENDPLPEISTDLEENLGIIKYCLLNDYCRSDYFFNKFRNGNHKLVKLYEKKLRALKGHISKKGINDKISNLKTIPAIRLRDPEFLRADTLKLAQTFLNFISSGICLKNEIDVPKEEFHFTRVAVITFPNKSLLHFLI